MDVLRRWARTYRTTFWLAVAFTVLLAVAAVIPDAAPAGAVLDPETTATPTPAVADCFVCPLDHVCDPESGQCVPYDPTPLPCIAGTEFDEAAGFCLPTGEPTPQPTVDPDEDDEPERGSGGSIGGLPGF